jgi:prephenate dehydrogenase
MNVTNREALIQALGKCRRQLDHFASFLEGNDEELISFLAAAENIKSALERLDSLKNE